MVSTVMYVLGGMVGGLWFRMVSRTWLRHGCSFLSIGMSRVTGLPVVWLRPVIGRYDPLLAGMPGMNRVNEGCSLVIGWSLL